jgi:hypothetical protein
MINYLSTTVPIYKGLYVESNKVWINYDPNFMKFVFEMEKINNCSEAKQLLPGMYFKISTLNYKFRSLMNDDLFVNFHKIMPGEHPGGNIKIVWDLTDYSDSFKLQMKLACISIV